MNRKYFVVTLLLSVAFVMPGVIFCKDRLKEINAYNTLYRLFECPFGFNNIAYSEMVHKNSPEWLSGILEDQHKSISNSKLVFKIVEDSQLEYNIICINFPAKYDMCGSGFCPDTMLIKMNSSEFIIEYIFTTTNPTKQSDEFAKICTQAGASEIPNSECKEFSYCDYHNYVIKILNNQEISFSYIKKLPCKAWWSIPASYNPESGWTELPINGPYNDGEEPFSTFLKKFNRSDKFRNERVIGSVLSRHDLGVSSGIFHSFPEYHQAVLQALSKFNYYPLKGHATDYCEEYQTYSTVGLWVFPTCNKIIYNGWSDDCSAILLFERIDGLWYCTSTSIWNVELGEAVREILKF